MRTGEPGYTTVEIGGLRTARLSRAELAQVMVRQCLAARGRPAAVAPTLVFSSNGQAVALAGRDQRFAACMAKADIVHADGASVVFASRLGDLPLPERVATTDFFHDAARAAVSAGLSFFFLGGSERQNAAAVAAVRRLYPALAIAGRQHGYFAAGENAAVCARIRASGADVLWVALGKPLQERWCVENRDRLAGIGWVKTCGGLYGFLAGDYPRAPGWMQATGFEWLFRAVREPRRLGWRYLAGNPYALYRLLRYTQRHARP
jgi:exopolysaccharide biosynthesis WecB/TagA/CpsF family protein